MLVHLIAYLFIYLFIALLTSVEQRSHQIVEVFTGPCLVDLQVCIPVVSVRLVKKHKTAGLVPNGLAITMDTGQKVPHRTSTHQR